MQLVSGAPVPAVWQTIGKALLPSRHPVLTAPVAESAATIRSTLQQYCSDQKNLLAGRLQAEDSCLEIEHPAIAPNGQSFAGWHGNLLVVHRRDGQSLISRAFPAGLSQPELIWHQDSSRLIFSSEGLHVSLDIAQNLAASFLNPADNIKQPVVVLPGAQYMLSQSGQIAGLSEVSGNCKVEPAERFCWDPVSRTLATASQDWSMIRLRQQLCIVSMQTRRIVRMIVDTNCRVWQLHWLSPDQLLTFHMSRDLLAEFWLHDVPNHKSERKSVCMLSVPQTLRRSAALQVQISPDGSMAALILPDALRIVQTSTGLKCFKCSISRADGQGVAPFAWAGSGKCFAVSTVMGGERAIHIVSCQTWRTIMHIANSGCVSWLEFAPDSSCLFALTRDSHVLRIFHFASQPQR